MAEWGEIESFSIWKHINLVVRLDQYFGQVSKYNLKTISPRIWRPFLQHVLVYIVTCTCFLFWEGKKNVALVTFLILFLSLKALKTFIFKVGTLCFSHSVHMCELSQVPFYEVHHYKHPPLSPGKIADFIHDFPFSFLGSVFLELDRYHLYLFFMPLKFSLLHYIFLGFLMSHIFRFKFYLSWISIIYILEFSLSIAF